MFLQSWFLLYSVFLFFISSLFYYDDINVVDNYLSATPLNSAEKKSN